MPVALTMQDAISGGELDESTWGFLLNLRLGCEMVLPHIRPVGHAFVGPGENNLRSGASFGYPAGAAPPAPAWIFVISEKRVLLLQ
jgi:hypothetical protein